ncbi:VRR-NUC domain-containing protein [Loigolactobacillus backii]|uniref:VRR-NUC domain-containing protein n=1 Tax=Loigolactobacillus backii TaxID=375175 RepID=UPI0022FD67CE|nr:VRR-NUC domain-containing protein [Loigolactobacillus backii]MDA5386968.1 VRR-NUC domain-containing protein [Loigolactobacillus backii]MDA5389506.1 VRR-NUC domain-containing protein [Loigolactobacillus backii]
MELERDVESYLKQQVKKAGGLSYKFVSPGQRGVPDQLIIYQGQVFFAEVKKSDGALRATQKVQIRKMQQHGASVFVIWSRADVVEMIKIMR